MAIIPLILLVSAQFLLQVLLVRRKGIIQDSMLVFLEKLLFMSASIVGVNIIFMLISGYLGDVKAYNPVMILFWPLGFFVSMLMEYVFLKHLIKQKLYISREVVSILTVLLGSVLGGVMIFLNSLL